MHTNRKNKGKDTRKKGNNTGKKEETTEGRTREIMKERKAHDPMLTKSTARRSSPPAPMSPIKERELNVASNIAN